MAVPTPSTTPHPPGIRKNGKSWHSPRVPFRPTSALKTMSTTYKQRALLRVRDAATKAQERDLKAEKEEDRRRKVQAIKDRRAAKEERVRFEEMAERMHRKKVERVRRREGRNKLVRSGK